VGAAASDSSPEEAAASEHAEAAIAAAPIKSAIKGLRTFIFNLLMVP
jgi:hypothetical protein